MLRSILNSIGADIEKKYWRSALQWVEELEARNNILQENVSTSSLDKTLNRIKWNLDPTEVQIKKVTLLFEVLCLNCSKERVKNLKNTLKKLVKNL